MSFYPELDELDLPALIARFEGPAPEGEGALYWDELARAIADRGADGAAYLWDHRSQLEPARLRAAIAALSASGATSEPRLRPWLRDQLAGSAPMVVAEAVDGLKMLNDTETADRILALQHHASEYVRGAVLRFARSVIPHQAFSLLVEALKDPHYVVREGAADELGELGDRRAKTVLEPLRNDPHQHVRQAVETALELLGD
jgi:HEAT repeat protein